MPYLSHGCEGFSSPDHNNSRQKLSLDAFVGRKAGENYATYQAKTNSEHKFHDPRHDTIVVAKFPVEGQGHATRGWAWSQLQKRALAQLHAIRFNDFLKSANHVTGVEPSRSVQNDYDMADDTCSDDAITFLNLQKNTLTSVASTDRSRVEGETCVFEDKLKDFETFVKSNGQFNEKSTKKTSTLKKLFKKRSKTTTRPRALSDSSLNTYSKARQDHPSEVTIHSYSCYSLPRGGDGSYPDFNQNQRYEQTRPWSMHSVFPHVDSLYNYGNMYPSLSGEVNEKENQNVWNIPIEHVNRFRSFSTDSPTFRSWGNSMQNERTDSMSHQRRDSSSYRDRSDSSDTNDLDPHSHPLLHAFIHHFFCSNHGAKVLCNLRGARKGEDSYMLSTPTVHSLTRSMGQDDLGVKGMREVIHSHVCGKYCRHLPDMTALLTRNISPDAAVHPVTPSSPRY